MTATSRLRSILRWLQAGYPDAAPGPDRVPLLALLCTTTLSDDEVDDVVRRVASGATKGRPVGRDEIADAIKNVAHRDASPENIEAVAVKLTAAGLSVPGAILRE